MDSQGQQRQRNERDIPEILAELCEFGVLENLRITHEGKGITYTMTDQGKERFRRLLQSPHINKKEKAFLAELVSLFDRGNNHEE